MSFKSENLILIIGNGFDLAHNLKTSYNDFANYIIEKKLTESIINSNNIDPSNSLLSGKFINDINSKQYISNTRDFINKLWYFKQRGDNDSITTILKQSKSNIKNIINNTFLGKLYDNQYENWFDIENAYFSELISIEKNNNDITRKKRMIKSLNENLIEIKSILFNYLKTIDSKPNRFVNSFFYSEQFRKLKNIYVINFNYTLTIENYLDSSNSTQINYIHGDIKSKNIVFGYGNDKHPKYNQIKETEIDEYLRFFKTFEYLDNNKYYEIYNKALEVFKDYDVSIIGHSLGQTDKTLLKEILDNSRCKRIHLYKRKDLINNPISQKQEFDKLKFSISRIIDNEQDLRVKVLNFEDSISFP